MLNNLFSSIISATAAQSNLTAAAFFACSVCSIILGLIIARVYVFKNQKYSKSFVITLSLLPIIVQMVIMLVNGNLGTGVAVMGAFSLVRFRSVPGSAKEICLIFLAMAVGLATGMGYLFAACVFVAIICFIFMLYNIAPLGKTAQNEKQLKITIPENLNYTQVFDDIFKKYTTTCTLEQVKTTNMGSLFTLSYKITLLDDLKEKSFIDELRCRNGNLEISCSKILPCVETL